MHFVLFLLSKQIHTAAFIPDYLGKINEIKSLIMVFKAVIMYVLC